MTKVNIWKDALRVSFLLFVVLCFPANTICQQVLEIHMDSQIKPLFKDKIFNIGYELFIDSNLQPDFESSFIYSDKNLFYLHHKNSFYIIDLNDSTIENVELHDTIVSRYNNFPWANHMTLFGTSYSRIFNKVKTSSTLLDSTELYSTFSQTSTFENNEYYIHNTRINKSPISVYRFMLSKHNFDQQIRTQEFKIIPINVDAINYFSFHIDSILSHYRHVGFNEGIRNSGENKDPISRLPKTIAINQLEFTQIGSNSLNEISISKSKNIIILDFWYSSCAPCINNIPKLNEFYNNHKNKIGLIGINPIDQKRHGKEKMTKILSSINIQYPVASFNLDSSGLRIKSYPTYVLLKNDEVIYVSEGYSEQLFKLAIQLAYE